MYEVQLGQLHYATEEDPVASHECIPVSCEASKTFLSKLVSFVMEARTERHFPPFRSEISINGSGLHISHPISELIHEATTSFFPLLTLGWILAFLGPSPPVHWMQNGCAAARVADEKKTHSKKENGQRIRTGKKEPNLPWNIGDPENGPGLEVGPLLAISPVVVKVHWLFESLRSSNLFL